MQNENTIKGSPSQGASPKKCSKISDLSEAQYRTYFEVRLADHGLRRNGAGHMARCCFHDDRTPSLSVDLEHGVWCCHAGCGKGGLIDFEALFSSCDKQTAVANIQKIVGVQLNRSRDPEATYDYRDAFGKLLFQVVRYPGKRFAQRRPNGKHGWLYTTKDVPLVLYRLPEVVSAKNIIVVEGEKDADNLIAACAGKYPETAVTTSPRGAGKWRDEFSAFFVAKQVLILPDNDDAGRKHAQDVAGSCYQHTQQIKVLELPGLPPKGDVSDLLKSHSADEIVALANQTPWWKPSDVKDHAVAVKPTTRDTSSRSSRSLHVVNGWEVKREITKFLWNPVFPLGKLVHFSGHSSQGKSPVTIDLLARISTGRDWPDGQPNANGPRDVLLLNVEDTLNDVIMPRFDLAGGDETRFHYIDVACVSKPNGKLAELMVALDDDIQELCIEARKIPELGAICIDPISNYLGKVKMRDEAEVRSLLTPLARLADELKITVITVGHFRKGAHGVKDDPLAAVMGASAFHGVARSVWALGPDSEIESPYAHIMAPARGATGDKAFKYHTEKVPISIAGESTEEIRVVWDGTSNANAEQAVNPLSRDQKSKITEAATMLTEFLKSGKRPAADCIEFLEQNGYAEANVNMTFIRRKAKVDSKRENGKWWWYLKAAGDYLEHLDRIM
jgi:RecA-family ATPase